MDGSQDIKEAVEQVVHYIFDHAKLKVRPVNRCNKVICQKTIKYVTFRYMYICSTALECMESRFFHHDVSHCDFVFIARAKEIAKKKTSATSERAVLMEVLYNFIRLHNKKKQFANSTDLPT